MLPCAHLMDSNDYAMYFSDSEPGHQILMTYIILKGELVDRVHSLRIFWNDFVLEWDKILRRFGGVELVLLNKFAKLASALQA